MPKKEIARIMSGFQEFREKYYTTNDSLYRKFATGWQGPKSLIIGCCDSRVDPAIIASAGPGDLFVARNVANLVPPYEHDGGHHGVSAAIEYAVLNLKVEHVIVLGHRQCGGIRALVFPEETAPNGFVQQWVKMAEPAKQRALKAQGSGDRDQLCRRCELESIKTSIENLRTFPFVADAVKAGRLSLLGLYFDIEKGELLELNEPSGEFSIMKPDSSRTNADWDERYSQSGFFFGTEPNDFLVENAGLFKKNMRVLCLADGEGRNSVFIAKQGCQVTAVDFSSVAIEKMKAFAKKNGVQVEGICADLNDFDLGTKKWDAVVSIWCHLPSVIRKKLHQRVVQSLKPSGIYLLESYTPNQIGKATGGPKDPDMLLDEAKVKEELAPLKTVKLIETEREVHEGARHNGLSSVIQLVAQKLI